MQSNFNPFISPFRIFRKGFPVLLFFIFFLPRASWSQTSPADSIFKILPLQKEDSNKLNLLIELSQHLVIDGEYGKALEQCSNALLLSERLMNSGSGQNTAFKKDQATTLNIMGGVYRNQGNNDKALECYGKALSVFKEIDDKKGIASSHNNTGHVHFNKGDFDKALQCYINAVSIREKIGDRKGMADSYLSIGMIYRNKGNSAPKSGSYEKAMEYYSNALNIYTSLEDKRRMGMAYNNIGNVQGDMGDYDSAIGQYFKAVAIKEEIGDKGGAAMTYNNIGNVYDDKGDYSKALEYYFKSVKINEELGEKEEIAGCYSNIALLYIKTGKINEARELSLKSLAIAREGGAKDRIKDAYFVLSRCDSVSGNFKGAYEYHKMYSDIKDSILNEESSRQIAEMQTLYETEKKEQQIALLNKDAELKDARMNRQQIIIWSVAAGFLVVLLLSVFIYKERKKSEKLLLNILPAETAKELKAEGKARAKQYGQVTVMFTDFKGFTSIAEKMSAQDLVNELDLLFRKFDEIISRYPIEKIKTIGDAYMCAGGLPVANTTNAKDIVSAALDIRDWMAAQSGQWHLRMGIHTGPVTAGVVGDRKFAYDIWGDAVNTASRMESSGEAGKINISESTYELIKADFECEYRGKVPAKNKGEIGMYFVKNRYC